MLAVILGATQCYNFLKYLHCRGFVFQVLVDFDGFGFSSTASPRKEEF